MTIQRMDHVGIVVDELAAAMAFFVELGLELDGETRVEGRWIDRIVGLEGVQADIAMMRIPDGRGRLELAKFHAPSARGVRSRSGEHAGHPSCHVRGTGHRRCPVPLARSRRRTRRRACAIREYLPALLRPRA